MKHGCICGWTGPAEKCGSHDGCKVCPRCLRRATIRYTFGILPCPKCKTSGKVTVAGNRLFYCHRCQMQFDDDPDEGGNYGNNPSRRMEREESRKRQVSGGSRR